MNTNLTPPTYSFLEPHFVAFVDHVTDPRVQGRCRHRLFDILAITFCGLLCGVESMLELEAFARQREKWFSTFLSLPNGIPSHDTFLRVLSVIDARELEAEFFVWIRAAFQSHHKNQQISLDGKSVAGTERVMYNRPLHMVEVFNTSEDLVLGTAQAAGSGMGEIPSMQDALGFLDLKGALVMVDAACSYPQLLEEVRCQKADYLVPIKHNQPRTVQEMETLFAHHRPTDRAETYDTAHGRKESRIVKTLQASKFVSEEMKGKFKGIKTLIQIRRSRRIPDPRRAVRTQDDQGRTVYVENPKSEKHLQTVTYYISSRSLSAEQALRRIRQHWRIENTLNWCLDVAFGEDDWRVRDKQAARALAILRRAAFNVLSRDTSNGSRRIKMKRLSWDVANLEKLLSL